MSDTETKHQETMAALMADGMVIRAQQVADLILAMAEKLAAERVDEILNSRNGDGGR